MPSVLKYVGFGETTGYGVSALALVRALKEQGVHVIFTELLAGSPQTGGHVVASSDSTTGTYQHVILHTVPEYYPHWIKKEKQHNPSVKVWGYTAWETDQTPDHWPALLNQLDGIFVPSQWNKEVFKLCGVTPPVKVLPHISEFHGKTIEGKVSSGLEKILQQTSDSFLFYNIGVWNERKAPWLLIQAFLEEFSSDEKVALLLKTGKQDWTSFGRRWQNLFRKGCGNSSTAFRKLLATAPRSGKVFHLSDHLTHQDIGVLHTQGDCFVSFARGEGWGMGAYEAAWFGKPIAMAGFGGPLDYLPQKLSYHLDFRLVPVECAYGQESYSPNQKWADIDIAKARKTLRKIFENRTEAFQKGQRLQQYIQQHFRDDVIAQQCLDALNL